MAGNFEFRIRAVRKQNGDESIFKNRTLFRQKVNKRMSSLAWQTDVGWFQSFFVLIMFCTGCYGYQEQRFAMEPQDQSTILGSRVTLPCRVENKAGTLQWTKDDFGLGAHRNLSGYERYRMIGSDEEGDYSLEIRDIKLEDDASYQCQVSSGLNGEPPIRSRSAQLTVLVAPDPPRIIQGAFIDATEDQTIDIECLSVGGKPAAEITWVDGNQVVIKEQVENVVELLPDGHRFTTRSTLRLTPNKSYHNQTLTCQAQNTADRAFRMATIHIEVKYAPKLKVFIKSKKENQSIREGREARISCEVDANPPPTLYQWYINNNPVVGDYADEMIIFNVSRKLNDSVVKCEVSNSVGTSSASKTLDVTYPPSFKTLPKNVEAEEGEKVTLNCQVDGHPKPEIRWIMHEPGRIGVKGKEAKLKINADSETAGRYLCKASADGYPDIEAEVNVFIKGPPKILSNRTQFGTEGDQVTLECSAQSVPKPDDISWYFQGREISVVRDQDYAIIEESLPNGIVRTSLVIRSSGSRHFGTYNCSVTNEYGNANEAILLKPHKTLPLLIILVGVTSGIVLFSALVVTLVICHRRRRRNNKKANEKPDVTVTTGDPYKESDRSSNISDLKLPHDGNYDMDYTSSENTGSTLKLAGLPLAGPVRMTNIRHDDPLMQFRYSNDYNDPTFTDAYIKGPGYLSYIEYNQDYPLPPGLRVQSPNPMDIAANRSLQGSLTRSIDTASTAPLSGVTASQNNSLKRSVNKTADENDAINNLGLPVGSEAPPTPIYAQPNTKGTLHGGGVLPSGLDVRYAATYGNPYLRSNSLGFGGQVHTAKPAITPAPPPYSAVRSSVVLPPVNGTQPSQAAHV